MSSASSTASAGVDSRIAPGASRRLSDAPWWLLVVMALGLVILYSIVTNDRSSSAFNNISKGIFVTLRVAFVSYVLALAIGLIVGLARTSSNKIVYNVASFYVEVARGIPMLVLLMYIAFVAVPLLMDGINAVGTTIGSAALAELTPRSFPNESRVIIGLALAYGAFASENVRAGIQSIDKGQFEASRALGMTAAQTMRHVILPQAFRRILPTLGNDFISMVKDSSLVSVLGVEDITQLTKLHSSTTFTFFQSYSILAFLYLTMTIMLSRGVQYMERRLSAHRR